MKTNSKENRANCVYMASGATIVHPRSSSVTGDCNNISKDKPFIENGYPQWDPSSRPKPLLNPDLIVGVKTINYIQNTRFHGGDEMTLNGIYLRRKSLNYLLLLGTGLLRDTTQLRELPQGGLAQILVGHQPSAATRRFTISGIAKLSALSAGRLHCKKTSCMVYLMMNTQIQEPQQGWPAWTLVGRQPSAATHQQSSISGVLK